MTTAYQPLEPIDDPAGTFAELRSRCPVHRFDGWGPPLFTVSRYEDVRSMLRDPRSWSSRFGQGPWRTEEPGFRNDPPEHTLYRRVLNRTLSAQVIETEANAALIENLTNTLLDALPATGWDLLDDLTGVLPFQVCAPILGMSVAEVRTLWTSTFDVLGSPETADPTAVVPFSEQVSKAASQAALKQLAPQLESRRSNTAPPRPAAVAPDLLTALVDGRDSLRRPFSDDTIVRAMMLVLFGAVHTTAVFLTNATLRLLDDRQAWTALGHDPSLADTVVEESLRFDPPVPGIFRTSAGATRLHDVDIPAGAKVRALFAAANRDPSAFENPDEFRLDRQTAALAHRHLGFGFGVHLCAGAPLARLEGRLVLRAMARHLPNLRPTRPTRWWAERDGITLLARHNLTPMAS